MCALSGTSTPFGRSGPSAQIAAHLDHDLRWIYRALILQYMNSLDFGFQPIAKRFEFRIPAAFYIETNPDTGEQQQLPIWSEGGIEPIAWKPFASLDPEVCMPIWKGDEFDGIEYEPKASGAGGRGSPKKYDIDLSHSLWVTNEQRSELRLDLRLSPPRLRLSLLVVVLVPLGHRRSRLRAQGRSLRGRLPPRRRVRQRAHRTSVWTTPSTRFRSASGCAPAA